MKYKFFDIVVFVFGLFFLALGIIAVINSFLHPEIANFLWLCYVSLILIGVGMILKSSFLIVMQINILFFPIIIWDLDFFYQLFSGRSLFGITDYFFVAGVNSVGTFVSLHHIYLLPLSIYVIYRLGVKSRKIWVASFIEVSLVFFLSYFFTSFERNTNCVFYSCVDFVKWGGVYYNLLWFGVVFVAVLVVNYFFVKFFYSKKKGAI